MIENKRYKLRKDAPAGKAGITLTWDSQIGIYVYDNTPAIKHGFHTHRKGESKEDVENSPEWFELIPEVPVSEEWEILKFYYSDNPINVVCLSDEGIYRYCGSGMESGTLEVHLRSHKWMIKEVKRLSDGEVFSVGDRVASKHSSGVTIKSFNVVKEKMMVECYEDYCDIYWLSRYPRQSHQSSSPDTKERIDDREPYDKFEVGVEKLINSLSLENKSDTPDYISAEFIRKVFELLNKTIQERTKWYGVPTGIISTSPNLFTQEEVDKVREDTWNAAREVNKGIIGVGSYRDGSVADLYGGRYQTLSDYLKSLKDKP